METNCKDFIKKCRADLGMTQAHLGELISVSQYNLSKYESGATVPPGTIILKILALCCELLPGYNIGG
jgi:transcriptional regulator with XRE-family HTH domain